MSQGVLMVATLLRRVVAFAAEKDRHRHRKDVDASPYINHPIAVAKALRQEGGTADVARLPTDWSDKRKKEYLFWVGQVAEGLHGANRPLEKILDSLLVAVLH